jgi:hypothetical protein
LLNQKAEIVATCRHRLKYMLTSHIWSSISDVRYIRDHCNVLT